VSTATFVLEDDGEVVACKITFDDGFDPTSRAHQATQMLITQMDGLCENLGPVPEKPETVVEAPSLIVVEGDRARKA
jgi:hypothetical protein